jgi:hypothetical protein
MVDSQAVGETDAAAGHRCCDESHQKEESEQREAEGAFFVADVDGDEQT